MGKRLKPIVGEIYGCYEVLSDDVFMVKDKHKDHHRGYYLAKCLVCGNSKYIRSDAIKNSSASMCRNCHNKNNYLNLVKDKVIDHKGYSVKHRGTGDLTRTWVLSHVKYPAIARGHEFDFNILTTEYLWGLFELQNRKCALTGVDLCFHNLKRHDPKTYNGNCHPDSNGTASLDRIDSSKGYVIGNVQWVHKDINIMKLDHSVDYFIKLCEMVYKHANQQPSIANEQKCSNEGSETRELNSSVNNTLQENPTSSV